ncbi:LysR family transcriptional regulator [Aliidongia dinghuensis]|uniref:LysR family transcriptional regulator n=1 Tax=Aliidongia dinghuensis TaxID=1867774 RepID=A0A8J2YPL7_9PROT|nr:LysR family transcriptional regulator [Aliidongia dinghuensis]GGF05083.1 LysR family transcriptional regulator [Aliidongia dinghuensis]
MDAADLRLMEAVARHGSMNRAAAELNTVQSNVTARIKQLEDQIGVPLFERHSRGVTPTAAGLRLLPYATRIGQLLKEARAAARDDGTPQGRLHLGTLETTAALRLPAILAAYAQAHPRVDLVITTGTSCSLIADVIEHRLDGAFVAGPVQHADLLAEAVFREELVLITARSIRTLDDLASVRDLRTIVFQLGCSYRQRLEAILAQRGLQAAQPLEFGSLDAILGCVAAGVGVTLLPKAVAAAARRDGLVTIHELPAEQAQVETLFIRRRDSYVTSALAAFLAMARPAPLAA